MADWLTQLPVHAVNVDGVRTPVIVGLVDVGGQAQLAVNVGEVDDPAVLAPPLAAQLVVNVEAMMRERRRR